MPQNPSEVPLAFSPPIPLTSSFYKHKHLKTTPSQPRLIKPKHPRCSIDTIIPDSLPDAIVSRLGNELKTGPVKSVTEISVGPGQHNKHFRYDTADGYSYFAKVNYAAPEAVFAAEAASLRALHHANVLRVPLPLFHGSLPIKGSFLVTEFIEFVPFGSSIPSVQRELGKGLAMMHKNVKSPTGRFGFGVDTYLQSGLQVNMWMDTWVDFFIARRLIPVLERAWTRYGSSDYGVNNESAVAVKELGKKLLRNNGEIVRMLFQGVEITPSLIHGDLFMGNCGADRGRKPVIFDPACSFAHSEMDLALNTMFGRFGKEFYAAYHEVIPRESGFEKRQELYRLYHYLNHLVLHGAGYGHNGTAQNPKGYYERCVELLMSLCGSSTTSSDRD